MRKSRGFTSLAGMMMSEPKVLYDHGKTKFLYPCSEEKVTIIGKFEKHRTGAGEMIPNILGLTCVYRELRPLNVGLSEYDRSRQISMKTQTL